MNKGLIFENAIMEIMHEKFPNEIATVASVYQAKSRLKFLETVNHINKGTPIIYQGVLHDDNRKIFGMPDLLVRSDYINKIFKFHALFLLTNMYDFMAVSDVFFL